MTKPEFDALLEFLYHGMHDDYTPTIENWLTILSIVDRYTCDKISARALREVEARWSSVEPVARIILAKRLGLHKCLHSAYAELVRATATPTHDEADKLWLRLALMIMRARATVLLGLMILCVVSTGCRYRLDRRAHIRCDPP
ncbi:hypothetical protein OF83DRAFT_148372 [Amylostereum chailletii]|nr:hypothetical protein OF83DRAFT_148372 [Amylostereum chailletii]